MTKVYRKNYFFGKISNSTTKYKYNRVFRDVIVYFYILEIKAIKNPIEFITVLYVKNAFKKLTSNNNTIT